MARLRAPSLQPGGEAGVVRASLLEARALGDAGSSFSLCPFPIPSSGVPAVTQSSPAPSLSSSCPRCATRPIFPGPFHFLANSWHTTRALGCRGPRIPSPSLHPRLFQQLPCGLLLPSPCPCQGAPEQQPGSQRSKEQRAGFARGHGSPEVRDVHGRAQPRLPRPAARGEEAEPGPALLLLRVYHQHMTSIIDRYHVLLFIACLRAGHTHWDNSGPFLISCLHTFSFHPSVHSYSSSFLSLFLLIPPLPSACTHAHTQARTHTGPVHSWIICSWLSPTSLFDVVSGGFGPSPPFLSLSSGSLLQPLIPAGSR